MMMRRGPAGSEFARADDFEVGPDTPVRPLKRPITIGILLTGGGVMIGLLACMLWFSPQHTPIPEKSAVQSGTSGYGAVAAAAAVSHFDEDHPLYVNHTHVLLEQERILQSSMQLLEEESRLVEWIRSQRGSTYILQPPPLSYGLGNQLQVLNNAFRLALALNGRLILPALMETWHTDASLIKKSATELRKKSRRILVSEFIKPSNLSEKVIVDERVLCSNDSKILSANKRWTLNQVSEKTLHEMFRPFMSNDVVNFSALPVIAFGELVTACKGQMPCVATHLVPRAGSFHHNCLFVADFNVNSLKLHNSTVQTLYDAVEVREDFKEKVVNATHTTLGHVAAFHLRWNERNCPLEVDEKHPVVCLFANHNENSAMLIPMDRFLQTLEKQIASMNGITNVVFLFSPFVPEVVAKRLRAAKIASPHPFESMSGLERNLADFLLATDAGQLFADPNSSWSETVSAIREAKGLPVQIMRQNAWK